LQEKAAAVYDLLDRAYPAAACSLSYTSPLELLVATQLAAQCTDKRVNMVTPALFKRFPTAEAFAEADIAEIGEMIRSTGFFRNKAKNIRECCCILAEKHNGEVPEDMETLLALPGVGRKTANLMLGDIFNKPAVVVDTHCIRISNRIGLVNTKNPEKIEKLLRGMLPPEDSSDFCHRMVLHGRAVCTARNPTCGACSIAGLCNYGKYGTITG